MAIATNRFHICLGILFLLACVSSTGCIGALAQLFYLIKGHDVPADYDGFEGKRVAVVVVTESSSYGPDPLSTTVEKYIAFKLATNVEEIKLVPATEVKHWIDVNDWNQTDFAKLGNGVKADFVLGINIDRYTIREGRTIYKGKSDVTVTVVESKTGEVTYAMGPEHFEFPENGRPAIQTTDRKFETYYLAWLTRKIARQFYKHDQLEDVAEDAVLDGF